MSLTTADRCDRCSARAYVLVSLLVPERGDHGLLFCAHHYQQHETQLMFSGARVLVDQRRELQSQASLV